jgi:hypothetical protein
MIKRLVDSLNGRQFPDGTRTPQVLLLRPPRSPSHRRRGLVGEDVVQAFRVEDVPFVSESFEGGGSAGAPVIPAVSVFLVDVFENILERETKLTSPGFHVQESGGLDRDDVSGVNLEAELFLAVVRLVDVDRGSCQKPWNFVSVSGIVAEPIVQHVGAGSMNPRRAILATHHQVPGLGGRHVRGVQGVKMKLGVVRHLGVTVDRQVAAVAQQKRFLGELPLGVAMNHDAVADLKHIAVHFEPPFTHWAWILEE